MISGADQQRLTAVVQRDWELTVATDEFHAICAGKERGHRIADYAEEKTVGFIEADGFAVAYEHGLGGSRRQRSMGDIWLRSGTPPIYNPINVKAGIAGVGGQPNMVSLAKLTMALLKHQIDSYWLLLIRITEAESGFTAGVLLINIFDYLGFMTFDSGPGQVMLRSDAFYAYLQGGGGPMIYSLEEVAKRLLEIRRDGDERLIANRARRLRELERLADSFYADSPVDQATLQLDRVG